MNNSTNPVFEKNLKAIERYNPNLCKELRAMQQINYNFQLVENAKKEPNLIVNTVLLHSFDDPVAEAENIFYKVENTPLSIHIVLGIGLGYLFKMFCNHSKGNVILYEASLDILRMTLELVDFSEELSRTNVYVASQYSDLKSILMNLYDYKSTPIISLLPSYNKIYGNQIHALSKELELLIGQKNIDYNFMQTKAQSLTTLIFDNLKYTLFEPPFIKLRDVYKGKTAIVVSAGPTLDDNIEYLKKYRDKAIIFAVGNAVKTLIKKGIRPDYINIIEMYDNTSQLSKIDISDIDVIIEPYAHTNSHRLNSKNKFLYAGSNMPCNKIFSDISGIDISQYASSGTVSYEALYCAKLMGFSKIILVGQDLAFLKGQIYSKDSQYNDLYLELNPATNKVEVKAKNLAEYAKKLIAESSDMTIEQKKAIALISIYKFNSSMYYVKGIQGEMLPTEAGFAAFVTQFQEFAKRFPNLNLINTSLIGAQLDGFENLPFEKAIEGSEPVSKIEHKLKSEIDVEKVMNNLDKIYVVLKQISEKMSLALEKVKIFVQKLDKNEEINERLLMDFKNIVGTYKEFYSTNNVVLKNLVVKEELEAEYNLKMCENYGKKELLAISESILNYYFGGISRQKEIIHQIKELKEQLGERVNTTR